jgi:transposase
VLKNGRELSAWLGLVPRQHSSGGRNVLLGINKRGDRYLRTLLIHEARSAIRWLSSGGNPHSIAITRRGPKLTTVALANHNARVLWALQTSLEEYSPRAVQGAAVAQSGGAGKN